MQSQLKSTSKSPGKARKSDSTTTPNPTPTSIKKISGPNHVDNGELDSQSSNSTAKLTKFSTTIATSDDDWLNSRRPYLFLASASIFGVFYFTYRSMQLSDDAFTGSSFFHSIGLFFFAGAVGSDCSSPILRKSFFMLHMEMALFFSVFCLANRRSYSLLRRIFHFSWSYLAVGIAAPLQLAFSGDTGLFDPWGAGDENHTPDSDTGGSVYDSIADDDADYDTYTLLYLNVLWNILSFFPQTTCNEQYKSNGINTFFDYAVMLWASVAILPLLIYKWRFALLPKFWSRLGFKEPGAGYTGLAIMNAIIVGLFAIQEYYSGFLNKSDEFARTVEPSTFADYNKQFLNIGIVDYVFMTLTLAVLVYRCDPTPNMHPDRSVGLTLLTLLLPSVGFPLFIAKIRSAQALKVKSSE